MYYNENSRSNSRIIGILRNRNCSDLIPIKIDGIFYTFSNTCTFDSLFQILCTAFVDDIFCAELMKNNNNEDNAIFEMITYAARDGINFQIYKKRAMILKSIINNQVEKNYELSNINCATTANYIIGKLFEQHPSYKEVTKCSNCNEHVERSYITITANLPTDDLQFLENIIKEKLTNSKMNCENCKSKTRNKIIQSGKLLFIEPIPPNTKTRKEENNFDLSVVLDNIPKKNKSWSE